MKELQEEGVTPIVIDLTNGDKLDESWLRMMGFGIKAILNRMFGGSSVPVQLKGNKRDIEAFTKTIGKEKRYMDALRKYGLDNPRTYKNYFKLKRSIADFTRKIQLKWPFR